MTKPKEPEVIAQFKECPLCKLRNELVEILGKPELSLGDGSHGFVAELANEVKMRGWMKPEMNFWAQVFFGTVQDMNPEMGAKIPIGAALPGFKICVEVCSDCGMVFGGKLIRGEAIKPSQVVVPGPPAKGKLPPLFPEGLKFGRG